MARTKGVNKTPAVWDYLSKHPNATAQEVVDGLKADGMEVSTSLIYNLKAMGKKKAGGKRVAAPAPSTNGATKADQIREVAGGMEKPVRPRDVIAVLKEKGVTASSAQVSTVLRAMGMKRKRRRRKMAVAGSVAVASNSLNIDDLVAAKKLVGQVGSIEKVREALAALARLT